MREDVMGTIHPIKHPPCGFDLADQLGTTHGVCYTHSILSGKDFVTIPQRRHAVRTLPLFQDVEHTLLNYRARPGKGTQCVPYLAPDPAFNKE